MPVGCQAQLQAQERSVWGLLEEDPPRAVKTKSWSWSVLCVCQREAEFALRAFSALVRLASSAGVLTRTLAIAWMLGAQK